jgi:hypothetical protein
MELTFKEGYRIKNGTNIIRMKSQIITTVSFIALLVNWYNKRLVPLFRNLFLIEALLENIT